MYQFHPLVGIWKEFRGEFRRCLAKENPPLQLMQAWMTGGERTCFYSEAVLPEVAGGLGLRVEKELLNIDWALCLPVSDEFSVPVIFVESENTAGGADQEVRKLCCVSAPLRILITVAEWDEVEGVWPNGGNKTKMLHGWQEIVRHHAKTWPCPSLLGILVGELSRDETRLRFYSYAIDPAGEVVADFPDDVLIEFKITSAWPAPKSPLP